jgi:phosphatidylserine/phosphatidylglycerophosphate/cardiolipin synthase-like enzyme
MAVALVPADWAVPLANEALPAFARTAIRGALQRVWAAVFLVDARPSGDTREAVRRFLEDLGYARWKGVDTRVLMGTSTIPEVTLANRSAAALLRGYGVEVREHGCGLARGLHGRYLVIDDDLVVIGSHDWTPQALHRDEADSLAIRSRALCTALAAELVQRWQEGEAV